MHRFGRRGKSFPIRSGTLSAEVSSEAVQTTLFKPGGGYQDALVDASGTVLAASSGWGGGDATALQPSRFPFLVVVVPAGDLFVVTRRPLIKELLESPWLGWAAAAALGLLALAPAPPGERRTKPPLPLLADMLSQELDTARRLVDSQKILLAERNAMLEQALNVRNQFLFSITHDLRTPLTGIMGHTELVLEGQHGPITPAQKEALESVLRNSRALLHLVSQLLDLAHLQSGKLEVSKGLVVLGECLEAAYGMVAPDMQARGMVLDADIPSQPIMVQGSFNRLLQVFGNLLSNAVKYAPGGRVGMRLTVVGEAAVVEVCDTGPGIPDDLLPQIFEEFVQARRSHRASEGGPGLGLAIARRIVEAHDGHLDAANRPEGGAIFTVHLPLR